MSAQETQTAIPVFESPETTLVLAFAEELPNDLQASTVDDPVRVELASSAAVDCDEIRARGARSVLIDLDVQPPDRDSIDVIEHVRDHVPNVRIIAVTRRGDPALCSALRAAGAHAVIVKRSDQGR